MKILHITPSTNGYEQVTLLANRYSKRNQFAVIEKNGELLFTGGFLINDTPQIRFVLDAIPKHQQYDIIKDFTMNPYAKSYFNESETSETSI